jgi:hypothetical protein
MKMLGATLLAGLVLTVLALPFSGQALDMSPTAGEKAGFLYSVPFWCHDGKHEDVIMVHHFSWPDATIKWNVSQANEAFALDSFHSPISSFDLVTLTPNMSTHIACADIEKRAGGSLDIALGFVEIISPVEINVVATHFRQSVKGEVTMDVEQYKPFAAPPSEMIGPQPQPLPQFPSPR